MREFDRMKNVTPNVEKKSPKERFEVSFVYEDNAEWPTTAKILTAEIKDYFGKSVKKVVVKKIS